MALNISCVAARMSCLLPRACRDVAHTGASLLWQALQHAGIGIEPEELQRLDRAKCGILIGTAMGGMSTFSSAVEDLTVKVRHGRPEPAAARIIVQGGGASHLWGITEECVGGGQRTKAGHAS